MLWGTCRGRKEPSNVVMEVGSEDFVLGENVLIVFQLSHLHDWIFQNIPESDICVEK